MISAIKAPAHLQPAARIAQRLVLGGRVQGVGFRPFVFRLADAHGIGGWVRNHGGDVHIHAEASAAALASFKRELIGNAPPLSRPRLESERRATATGRTDFSIRQSRNTRSHRVHVPPDQFACDDCIAEMQDPAARRFQYPFINCTQCGPRYTLIRRMPYDRPNTTMAEFALCPECDAEYRNPVDRRFHAQPLGCSSCGPRLRWREGAVRIDVNDPALDACVAALQRGSIVAVRGIGGYHLMCNARDDTAVERLRARKQRPHKPLAVMVPTSSSDLLVHARELAPLRTQEARLLANPMRPIVLVSKMPNARLAQSIAPGLKEVGIMLPYSPLHHLLTERFDGPLVATSGNLSGEPVLTAPEEVERRLGAVADAFLHHDRSIERPADDPVYRLIAKHMRPIRLGRGCAPLEFELPMRLDRPLIATGAFLKNTIALAWEDRIVISPHIGDLGSARARTVFAQVAEDLQALYGVRAAAAVCDAHPNFPNANWARETGLPVHCIYHHRAHASALAGEFDVREPILVFTWDGVGYGEDGTLWGGEALLGEPGRWRRAASFRPFRLPGGERATYEPWRTALALTWEAGVPWEDGTDYAHPLLRRAWERGMNCPTTTAVGRLFDAAAALTGTTIQATFEGQGPMHLEALATERGEIIDLPLQRGADGVWRTDWAPLIALMADRSIAVPARAATFHASLAFALAQQAEQIRDESAVRRVGLTGGVFQNRRLAEAAIEILAARGFDVLIPTTLPVNDAGISYGQIVEAAAAGLM